MMHCKVFVCSAFQQNSRVLWDEKTKQALVIDPGSRDAGIVEFLQEEDLDVEAILLTHSHVDHFGGVQVILDQFPDTPLYGHEVEKEYRQHVAQRLAHWGISPELYDECPEPTHYVTGGELLHLLGVPVQVIATPGHSPGSVSFYFPNEQFVVSGDVLFRESVGRTDLPGGNWEELHRSLQELLKLPRATKVLSGHGPDTTIDDEIQNNRYIRDAQ